MANPFVHVELATIDLDKAKTFYRSLFDWQLQDMDMGGSISYTMIGAGEGTGGGMMKHPVAGAPSAWQAYALVDDVAPATANAKSLGATVMRDVTASRTTVRSRSSSIRRARHWGCGSRRPSKDARLREPCPRVRR